MGQRLVITVHAFDEDICSIYYHWSAYTTSALSEVRDLLGLEEDCTDKKQLIHNIADHLMNSGGGMDELETDRIKEWDALLKICPEFNKEDYLKKQANRDRSYGLMAITPEGMKELMSWAEGTAIIDFDEQLIHFDVFYTYENLKAYNAEMKDVYEDDSCLIKDIDELPAYDDLSSIPFEDIDTAIDFVSSHQTWHDKNGVICDAVA